MFLLVSLCAPAEAGFVEVWTYDRFEVDADLAGADGWEGGYDGDPWSGARDGGDSWAYSTADHAPTGDFGAGGPHDNWLVHEAADVQQGAYTVTAYPTDNDAFGVVFGHNRNDYYMLLVCGEEGNDTSIQSCPISGLAVHVTALVYVSGSQVEVLDSADRGASTYEEAEVDIVMDNGQLTATIGRVSLSSEVDEDFVLNGVGFYAFNEGVYDEAGESDGDTVFFRNPVLAALDEDDDGVVDDEDNCEADSNPDQEDADGDGLGTACDEEEAPVDTGSGDTGTDDTGGGGGGGGKKDNGTVSINKTGCGCDAGGGAAGVGAVALTVAALRRRRGVAALQERRG